MNNVFCICVNILGLVKISIWVVNGLKYSNFPQETYSNDEKNQTAWFYKLSLDVL